MNRFNIPDCDPDFILSPSTGIETTINIETISKQDPFVINDLLTIEMTSLLKNKTDLTWLDYIYCESYAAKNHHSGFVIVGKYSNSRIEEKIMTITYKRDQNHKVFENAGNTSSKFAYNIFLTADFRFRLKQKGLLLDEFEQVETLNPALLDLDEKYPRERLWKEFYMYLEIPQADSFDKFQKKGVSFRSRKSDLDSLLDDIDNEQSCSRLIMPKSFYDQFKGDFKQVDSFNEVIMRELAEEDPLTGEGRYLLLVTKEQSGNARFMRGNSLVWKNTSRNKIVITGSHTQSNRPAFEPQTFDARDIIAIYGKRFEQIYLAERVD